jgi:hypothetical protein
MHCYAMPERGSAYVETAVGITAVLKTEILAFDE